MINLNSTKLPLLCFSSLFLIACDPEFSNPVGDTSTYSSGDADFSKYVAVGDSLTAGFADAALYRSAQIDSFPNILATQFKTVGGGDFVQPLMDDNIGGLKLGGTVITANRKIFDGSVNLPVDLVGDPSTDVIGSTFNGLAINNTGVPGAKSFHLTLSSTNPPAYGDVAGILGGTANPYFVRFASSSTTSVIADAAIQAPTFFSLWIGNNDVLSYATSGGVGSTAGTNSADITPTAVFDPTYASLVTALTANPNTKGILINIPDVSSIPFFTTVVHNPLTPDKLNSATITFLNSAAAYGTYNAGVQAALGLNLINATEAAQRTITFTEGQDNAVVIIDDDLTDITAVGAGAIKMRQATASDLILLTTGSIIGEEDTPGDQTTTWGVGKPLEDEHVLIPSEIAAIETARTAFNTTIKNTADANPNLAFYDAAAFMDELKANGIDYGTGSITSAFASGGGFSLDGVHPTARGYSIVANGIIDTINTTFNANIPKVDPGTKTTIFIQ